MESFQKTIQQLSNPKQKDQCGVYHLDIPKRSGYARTGLPLYNFDPMYDYLVSRGDTPAFPNREDVPRGELVSFDEFYIPSISLEGERVFNRITLTRAHTRNKGQAKGCFINGNLVYTSGTGALYDRVTLYNPGEWNSGAKPMISPHLWFTLGEKIVTIIANEYLSVNFNKMSMLWAYGITKNQLVDAWKIYINDKNLQNGKTKEKQDFDNRFWRYGWLLILLAPLWLVFILIVTVLSPLLVYAKRSEIRMYLVEPASRKGVESGEMRAKRVSLKYITDPTNRSPLI